MRIGLGLGINRARMRPQSSGGGAAAYSYFRLTITASPAQGGFCGVKELEIRESIEGQNAILGKSITATASETASGASPARAFDGEYETNDSDDGWYTSNFNGGEWIQVQLLEDAISPAEYALHGYPASFNYATRSPTSWTLEASNDGETWDLLDTQEDFAGWSGTFGQLHEFQLGE